MNDSKSEIYKRSFNIDEAAQYVGLSQQSLREACCYGPRERHLPPPPFIRLGRCIRFLRDDLDRWLEQNRVELKNLDDQEINSPKRKSK